MIFNGNFNDLLQVGPYRLEIWNTQNQCIMNSLPSEQFFMNSGGKRVRLQLLRHINRHFLRYDMSHRVVCPMR